MDLREFLLTQILRQADNGGAGGGSDEGTPEDKDEETPEGGDEENTEGTPENKSEEKTFTQEELERIIAERLAREKKKREDAVKKAEEEAERKRLEEQGEYKELAEKLQNEVERLKAEALATKKVTLLKDAGYNDEQVELFTALLQGETDEELASSLELLKKANPPVQRNYVDPSAGNGGRNEPEKKSGDDIGKSAYERLKSLGKIRRK